MRLKKKIDHFLYHEHFFTEPRHNNLKIIQAKNTYILITKWGTDAFVDTRSCILMKRSTKVVEPVRVRAGLIMLLNELEVMGCLVYDHSRILPAAVNDVTQAIPWVLLHKKLGGDVFHFHNLCAVRDVIYCGHSDSCKTEHRSDPSATHSKDIWFI